MKAKFATGVVLAVLAGIYAFVRLFEDVDIPGAGVVLLALAGWELHRSYRDRRHWRSYPRQEAP